VVGLGRGQTQPYQLHLLLCAPRLLVVLRLLVGLLVGLLLVLT
jgi:hypothetical protein